MKKWTAIWMAALFLMLPLLAAAEGTEEAPVYPEELLVGNPTEMKGDFFTEMFGNNTADIDMRALIHGYNLVNWDENQGEYRFDPSVVTNVLLTESENGNHTYYMALAHDLFYSDGTQITAWDYAFSLLLMMRPEMEEIGAKIYRQEHLWGSAAYITGATREMAGVQVLSDYQLAVTLDGAYLPFFYETGLLLCVPYPIRVIAPGCRVYDEGKGAYIGNEDPTAAEPVFTAELLRKTILDPETGYLSHPSVSSGPYRLVSFDGVTAHAELNPYYKGKWEKLPETTAAETQVEEETAAAEAVPENYAPVFDDDGNLRYYLCKPAIGKIAFTCVKSEDAAQLFADGQIHVVNKLVYGPAIQEMLHERAEEKPAADGEETEAGAPEEEEESYRFMNYPRLGLTMLSFSCERPAVQEKEVRQAIAWCMDRDALTLDYTAGYGQRVDGYYGIEKWENALVSGRIDPPVTLLEAGAEAPHSFENLYAANDTEYEAMVEAWQALNLDGLTVYTVDTGKAAALLDGAGWTRNDAGLRQKEIDGQTVVLDLKLMYPEGNRIAESMEENFLKHLEEAGIRVTLVPAPMDTVLSEYYHETERTADMIYLGTNFHVVFDPSITYSTAQNARWNNTFSEDEELYQRAVALRQTEPRDLYTYITRWIAFQERYNEVLPAIPVYSNIYFDFYVPYLQNYNPGSHTTWSQAITESWFGEVQPAAEETEEADGDGITFEE